MRHWISKAFDILTWTAMVSLISVAVMDLVGYKTYLEIKILREKLRAAKERRDKRKVKLVK